MKHTLFIPGRELSRRLYEESVRPLMQRYAPQLPYGAALIGAGSDVLGYDTARSMDHDWGPRLTVFLPDAELASWADRLGDMFLRELPAYIGGFPTRFREFEDDPGIVHMATGEEGGPRSHRIRITSVPAFMDETLGIRSTGDLDVATWLTVPEQTLLELTAGAVFRDDQGHLSDLRGAVAWYPDEVWRYRLAAAWKRIAQIEPFVGRAGEVGDDVGSHLIAMSLVRDIMRLALLQERQYAPYAKWLGTAFARLDVAPSLSPLIDAARFARSWQERERGVVQAVVVLAKRQNRLELSEPIDPAPRGFHARPFTVIDAERFADALTRSITDPDVRALPTHLGGIDQYVDSTDALVMKELRMTVRDWLRTR